MKRHKWSKDLANIEFIFESRGSRGAIVWRKSKEFILQAGAVLEVEPQMNKDGTKNYSAKFAEALRGEHANAIENFRTTRDLIFPSPNEYGIFLRYGGDNSWLDTKDEFGKTLDEHSEC